MARPAVILVGADKGGVGKTTVTRTLLDYFVAHQVADPRLRYRIAARHAQALSSRRDRGRRRDPGLRSDENLRHAGQRRSQGDGHRRARRSVVADLAGVERNRLSRIGEERARSPSRSFTSSAPRSLRSRKSPRPPSSSATPTISWSRTSSTIRPSSSGTRRPTIPISRDQGRRGNHHSEAQRDGLRAGRSAPASVRVFVGNKRRARAKQPTIRSFCAAMSAIGLAMSGVSSTA